LTHALDRRKRRNGVTPFCGWLQLGELPLSRS
jgi:hypothetical protein